MEIVVIGVRIKTTGMLIKLSRKLEGVNRRLLEHGGSIRVDIDQTSKLEKGGGHDLCNVNIKSPNYLGQGGLSGEVLRELSWLMEIAEWR